jgi:hypothetical protein
MQIVVVCSLKSVNDPLCPKRLAGDETPGSRDSPVMSTPESYDSNVVNTPESRLRIRITSRIFEKKSKSFLGLPHVTRISCLMKKLQ